MPCLFIDKVLIVMMYRYYRHDFSFDGEKFFIQGEYYKQLSSMCCLETYENTGELFFALYAYKDENDNDPKEVFVGYIKDDKFINNSTYSCYLSDVLTIFGASFDKDSNDDDFHLLGYLLSNEI